ncbi:4-hydroxythreonine-4-phosphate dehydrogenase PdxA [Kordiimonas aquimaris]|uniref:4-hydroxythreonine-4-phosphate dehydrogenase PdxA n=1 Tax=Kordiimonas aquimaris TaxID=707591 RepID=UPI0021D30124|nr:4-hydroxythreonine-4-phosphate dehydrogenase PdxA [Kordiimonas aquimaris]
MSISAKKPLAITMGEPAGIGPELISRLWRAREQLALPPFVYAGSAIALKAVDADLPLNVISETDAVDGNLDLAGNRLTVIETKTPITTVVPGTISPENAQAVIDAIDSATSLALNGHISGVVTAPIHKAALYKVGFDAPGHTEYLARLCGLEDNHSIMMLAAQNLRVVPVTVHVPLKDVHKHLTTERIIHAGTVINHDLRNRFNIAKPRIAVAGLNPHAGESGMIGMEEATHIAPAIWALRDNGVNVTDPLPADTLFHADARENYDAVLCMYHDQALIPVKTLDFWGGVNITLGLPIIRTSPDHGTALELAGKGIARLDSMLAAIRMTADMIAKSNQRVEK